MFGTTVIHAMVITDIDDKIIQRGWQVGPEGPDLVLDHVG